MSRVIVHIDRLVLEGFPHEVRHAIGAGLRAALVRAFADSHIDWTAMRDVPRLQLRGVHIEPGAKPRRIGENVARAIGEGLPR